jgi:hypothetical protein
MREHFGDSPSFLTQAVELLAASATEQMVWTDKYQYPVDELMQHLDDAILVDMPYRIETGELSPVADRAIRELHAYLLAMDDALYVMWSGNERWRCW